MNARNLLFSIPSRIATHLAFWGFSYYVLIMVFSGGSEVNETDHLYTALFLLTIITGVYINNYLLIPHFLTAGRYILYGLLLPLCILGSAFLNQLLFSELVDYILPGYYFISYFSFADIVKFMAAFIIAASLIKLSKGYFSLMESRNQLIQLQRETTEAQLRALRAQVNPHFLFNSLNSIYALVLKKSDRSAETILKLSDLLRYILYESRKDRVSLAAEIGHMQHYIELQKMRCHPGVVIETKVTGDPGARDIVPLLFLPLIENSFKHGIKGNVLPGNVSILWSIEKDSVRFVCENSKGVQGNPEGSEAHGIGLENLRKRLNLTCPGQYRFEISETESRYKTEMLITTTDED